MNTTNKLNELERKIIYKYKEILIQRYPDYVQNIYLFGSKARGDFDEDSDIDILVTLKNYDWKLGDKIRRIGYELDEEIDSKFSIIVLPESEFQTLKQNRFQFIQNVIRDEVLI